MAAQAPRTFHVDRPLPQHVALSTPDDLIAAIGTWTACARHRTKRPLLPALLGRHALGRA